MDYRITYTIERRKDGEPDFTDEGMPEPAGVDEDDPDWKPPAYSSRRIAAILDRVPQAPGHPPECSCGECEHRREYAAPAEV